MIKKSMIEDELIRGMQRELQSKDKNYGMENLVTAAEYIHSVIDILEECGLTKKADQLVNFLNKIAQEQNAKDLRKLNDPHTKGLTSEKMIKNLLHHGTTFNMADDNKADDLLNLDINDSDLEVENEEMDFEDEI